MEKILVIDDMEINLEILEGILEDYYCVLKAHDGLEAVQLLDENPDISLMLLDLCMPRMDGFGVMNAMKESGMLGRIPIIVITGDDSLDNERRCYDYGVSDFIRKPFNSTIVRLRVGNIVKLYSYKNSLEDTVAEQTEDLKKQYLLVKEQATKLVESNQKIIDILGTVVESRNLESGQHIQRVKNYTEILAKQVMADCPEYGITQHAIDVMVPASALHDVGKIAIPDNILLKPGRLTSEEFDVMKSHTIRGCEILDNIKGAWDKEYARMSYEICRYHHEKYDGKGYPDGLVGDDIPIAAQIVSVADIYDALVNERCYKDAFSKEKAFEMITQGECGAFSDKLMNAFSKVREEFEKVTVG